MDIDRLEGPDLVRAVLEARGIPCYEPKDVVPCMPPVPYAWLPTLGGVWQIAGQFPHGYADYDPTRDLNQAWELVTGITTTHLWEIYPKLWGGDGGVDIWLRSGDGAHSGREHVASAPLAEAICRVFLKAKANEEARMT